MAQQTPNLGGIERGWAHLMRTIGKTLPKQANRNRILLSVINSRMRGR